MRARIRDTEIYFDVEGMGLVPDGRRMREQPVACRAAAMADVIGNMRLSNFWVMIPLIAPKMKGRRQRPHAVAGLDDAYLPARSLSRMARNSSPSTQLGQSVVFASARPTS